MIQTTLAETARNEDRLTPHDRVLHRQKTSISFWDYLKNTLNEEKGYVYRTALHDVSLLSPDLLTDLYVKLNKELRSDIEAEGEKQASMASTAFAQNINAGSVNLISTASRNFQPRSWPDDVSRGLSPVKERDGSTAV
ncbi:hypothetical protein FSPOR_5540 [Fusarium sporotrichioides]|uniref:Uncharacterized protein n=1 Tax=Fusarium sporotrichioides TaxID=5514 RepID=A0A395S6P9_FUSSP|nr:hypothetical protein FSPOR_5540 [Fusarium sporotrichioides]